MKKAKAKTKLAFGKRGGEETRKTERKPTLMERLQAIGSRWWRGYPSHNARGAKLSRPRVLPQRRQ